jgi:hypothetical protein
MIIFPRLLGLLLAANLAAALARAQPVGCGDGVVDPDAGETCDQGAANGTTTSCCTASCTLRDAGEICRSAVGACDVAEACDGVAPTCPPDAGLPDGDGDGVCDAYDDCPLVADPGQEDDDGDGRGNACDPCTNVVPTTTAKAVLKISKLLTPPGDDRLKLKASIADVPAQPTLNPIVQGLRVILSDALGDALIDVRLPGGAYSTSVKAGWKGGGTGWNYANGGQILPLLQGITKVSLRGRTSQPGVFSVAITGKNGSYAVPSDRLPVLVTVVMDPPLATTGQCAEIAFGSSACHLATNGSLICK